MNRNDEIRARFERATPRKWYRHDVADYAEIFAEREGGPDLPVAIVARAEDADFIANSTFDVHFLLYENDCLAKALETLKGRVKEFCANCPDKGQMCWGDESVGIGVCPLATEKTDAAKGGGEG